MSEAVAQLFISAPIQIKEVDEMDDEIYEEFTRLIEEAIEDLGFECEFLDYYVEE